MAKKAKFDYDLIVIGSGAGGSAAASIASRAGKRVAIVESDVFGGSSPNYSDVPLDAVRNVAQIYDRARHSAKSGIRSTTIGYNYPSIRAWKELVVARTGAGGNRRYYENLGVVPYVGHAHFLTPNEISVNRRHLSAKNFIIATGSTWVAPIIPGLTEVKYHTPKTILQTMRPPKSLAIIGGSNIGVEIAQLLATFGTKVYIVDKDESILPSFEPEVRDLLEKTLDEQKGVTCFVKTEVVAVRNEPGGLKKLIVKRGKSEKFLKVDEIMIACGRKPSLDLGLENAGVKYSSSGIKVNDKLQTTIPHIYAAGDCIGGQFNQAHSAILESRVAVHNIINPNQKITPDYTATPITLATYPGVAQIGLLEENYKKRNLKIKTAIAPLSIIAKSNTTDFHDGFVKLITNYRGVLIAGTIVAPNAEEMIHELAIAIKYKLTATQLSQVPHAFLTWSEALRVAATKLS